MTLFEVILLGAALSADAMSVTIANVLAMPQLSRARALAMPVAFGLFQGIMPVAGYLAGSLAAGFIEQFAGIIALVVLGAIGAKMIVDGVRGDGDGEGKADGTARLSAATLLAQAVATSIDALGVGVSLAASGEPIVLDAGIIALCTFALCLLMVFVGKRVGPILGQRAQVVGGVVLIAIGVRAMFF